MPTTINGIGTTYYGKKNLERYQGVCESCRREVELHNYETKLWFTVFYVPVIPLGKQQVFGDCTRCRRHRSMPADQWAKVKEDSLRSQMAAVAANPGDADAALELLGMLGAFSRRDDALRMAEVLEQRFPENVGVRLRLGEWYESIGEGARADAHFRRALELAPDNLPAKHAVAVGHIQDGNIDAARKLLNAAPALAPANDPGVYLAMAEQLQKQNRHEQALAIFRQLIEAVPGWSRDPQFRERVRISERQAAAGGESLLPSIPLHRRRWFWPSLLGTAALAAFLFAQYYVFHHRTLHVVNGYSVPVEVRLDSGERVSVPPGEIRTLSLAEGAHRATTVIDGREGRGVEFAVESTWIKRLFADPVFVLNVDGAAVVLWEKTVYGPVAVQNEPVMDARFYIGKSFISLDEVDYLFQPFPDKLTVEKKKLVTKTRIGVERVSPGNVLLGAPDAVSPSDRLDFAEAHLRTSPVDADLLEKYAAYANLVNETSRSLGFLKAGLDTRPVNIAWHHAYQNLRAHETDDDQLAAEYRKRLEAEPNDSAWPYLLGRIETDPQTADALFQRSIDADSKNPFPWYAKGFALHVRGDFQGAKAAAAEACRLNPKDALMNEALYVIRLGAGEAAKLEGEVEREWHENSHLGEAPGKLLEVLAIQGKTAKMHQVFEEYRRRVAANPNDHDKARTLARGEVDLHFYLGDYRKVANLATALPSPEEMAVFGFAAHAALGDFAAAENFLPEMPPALQANARLALSIAWRRQGSAAKADELQRQVVEAWDKSDAYGRRIAETVRRIPNVTYADAENLSTSEPYEKALLLTALGQQCPGDRDKLLAQAAKQNFRPWPYRRLIEEAISAARKKLD